jgi:hypothetical protein
VIRPTPAEELLQSLGISKPGDIDLKAIAWHCGAEVRIEPLDGCEARIIGSQNKAIITVADGKLYERQRFSIGHELGHWKYHRGQAFICRSNDIGSENRSRAANDPEKVADDYAVNLLMPRYLFEPEARKAKATSFEAVLNLKALFITSITATALRFVDFSPETSMLVCYDQLGMKWFKKSRDVPTRLFLKHELDHDTIAFDVLYGEEAQHRPRVIDADSWFENRGADRYELYEDSIRIHDGRILTLLSWRDEEMLEKYAA